MQCDIVAGVSLEKQSRANSGIFNVTSAISVKRLAELSRNKLSIPAESYCREVHTLHFYSWEAVRRGLVVKTRDGTAPELHHIFKWVAPLVSRFPRTG